MTVFGDLETSTLAELPAGRSPIATSVVPAGREAGLARPGLGSASARRSPAGHQAYVVCPRIGDGDGDRGRGRRAIGGRAAEPTAEATTPGRRRRWRRRRAGRCCADGPAGRPAARGPARAAAAGGEGPRHDRRSRPARSTSWSRRPSSRSGSTCRTPRSWSCWTPTGSASRSCTSCAAGSAAAARRACACWSPTSPAGTAGARAAGRGRRDHRRLRAGPARRRAAARGRRAGRGAVRAPLAAQAAVAAARRGPDRRPRGRGERPGRRRPRAGRAPACWPPQVARLVADEQAEYLEKA